MERCWNSGSEGYIAAVQEQNNDADTILVKINNNGSNLLSQRDTF